MLTYVITQEKKKLFFLIVNENQPFEKCFVLNLKKKSYMMVNWKVHRLTKILMECEQMKFFVFFYQSSPCRPLTFFYLCCSTWIPMVKKCHQLQKWHQHTHTSTADMTSCELFQSALIKSISCWRQWGYMFEIYYKKLIYRCPKSQDM